MWVMYAVGFFSLGLVPLNALLMVFWGAQLGASPGMIGLMVGIRSLLPLFLSLHTGSMIDQLGPRRIMIAAAIAGVVTVPIYPVLPYISVALALQVIGGMAQQMIWIAAQSIVAQKSVGRKSVPAIFTFSSVVGTALAPLIIGAVWMAYGAGPSFLITLLWSVATMLVVILYRSETEKVVSPIRFADFLPDWKDYLSAWQLMHMPVVSYLVAMTFFRLALLAIQSSFYVIFLQQTGQDESQIGWLIAVTAVVTAVSSFLTIPLGHYLSDFAMLTGSTVIGIVCLAVTPLLPTFSLLMFFAALLGICQGVGAPLILSMISSQTPPDKIGLNFGLRGTANRLASLVVPSAVGMTAGQFGYQVSFYMIGLLLISGVLITAFLYHKSL